MSQFKPPAEAKLAQEYFYNLIQNPGTVPPAGLDLETVRLVRELVEAEYAATPASGMSFEATRQRIRQRVRPPAGLVESRPTAYRADTEFQAGEPLPLPLKRARVSWEKFVTLAGMAATIVLLVGLLGLSLAGVRPPDAPIGSSASPTTVQAVQTVAPSPSPAPSPTPRQFTKSPLDTYNPKMLLQKALVDLGSTLNLDPDTLLGRMEKGETLGGIAKQQGIDPTMLRKMLLGSFENQLDAAVKSGDLTQAQADEILNSSQTFIDNVINNSTNSTSKIPPTK